MLKRLFDWPTRLDAHFRQHMDAVCVWGETDCFTLPNRAVEVMTGTDPLAPAKGWYATPLGALRLLRKHGLADVPAYWTFILGEALATPKLASRGDIVVLDPCALEAVENEAFAVSAVVTLDGRHAAYLDARGGLRFTPLAAAATAWRVG
jgi:hypothetical protein